MDSVELEHGGGMLASLNRANIKLEYFRCNFGVCSEVWRVRGKARGVDLLNFSKSHSRY